MDLVNETLLQSHMARTQLAYKDLLQTIVVVKGSFDVLASGETRPSAEQPEVLLEDAQTAYGTLESEVVPAKGWCDLAVLGHAWSPTPGEPVREMTVGLRIGAFVRSARVSGDRVWVKALGRMVPSEPAPFTKLPLSYEHAFGGFARQKEIEAVHFDNPFGKGYVLAKEHVEGTALPNIEEVDELVESWSDRPSPAGFAPLPRQAALRAHRGFEATDDQQSVRIRPAAFCFAHPRMTVPAYPEGEEAELVGVTASGGTWRFRLPRFRSWIRVDLGARRYQLPVVADTVYVLPDEQRVVVVGRCTFLYQFLPERRRTTRVMPREDTTATSAPTSIRELRVEPRADVPITVEQPTVLDIPLEEMIRRHPMNDMIEGFPLCPSG
jgi:hypothetical protein